MVRDESAVSSPPMVTRCVMPAPSSVSSDRARGLRGLGRVLARGAENRAAGEVDPRHVVDRQVGSGSRVAPHEILEAVPDADHLEAFVDGLDGGRGNDRVDAGRRTSADQDAQPSSGCHACMPRVARRDPTAAADCVPDCRV